MHKIGFVNYLNSLPLCFGLEDSSEFEVVFGTPAEISDLLLKGEVTAVQIPSYDFLQNRNQLTALDNLCISAAEDKVSSVLLFSKNKIENLSGQTVHLTNHSRTSVQLLKILLKEFGCQDINYVSGSQTTKDLENSSKDNVLIIGNEALKAKKAYEQNQAHGQLSGYNYYDLASLWKNLTGLPFVFAVFAFQPDNPLPANILKTLETNLEKNLQSLSKLTESNATEYLNSAELYDYLSDIRYSIDDERKESLQKFANLLHLEEPLKNP